MLNILAEGQYILPMCTIFGLEEEERGWLVQNQAKLKLENKLTDKDDDHEGIEVATSAFKVALSWFVWFVVVSDGYNTHPNPNKSNFIICIHWFLDNAHSWKTIRLWSGR